MIKRYLTNVVLLYGGQIAEPDTSKGRGAIASAANTKLPVEKIRTAACVAAAMDMAVSDDPTGWPAMQKFFSPLGFDKKQVPIQRRATIFKQLNLL